MAIFSVIETAKANKLEPYWYLRFLLEKLSFLESESDFELFTPQNVDKALVQALKDKYMGVV